MAIFPDISALTILTATSLEARAARRELPHARVVEGGVAATRIARCALGDIVISCGLAGGLRRDLPTGTVVVPRTALRPDGTLLHCDDALVEGLVAGAHALGLDAVTDPLVTHTTIVRGDERARWAERGYAAADMETGLIVAPRIAAIRVVLDTPERELSGAWLHPARALRSPRNWPEALWLAREAPRCSRLAARVLRYACEASACIPASVSP